MKKFLSALGAGLEKVGLVEQVSGQDVPVSTPATHVVEQRPVTTQTATTVPVQQVTVDSARLAELDAAAKTILINALENDGAPLVEDVEETLETLMDAIPDDRARYVSALKLIAKRGHPVSAVLSDFDRCLGVLEQNKRNFETDSQSQFDAKVGTKMRNIEQVENQIREINAKIESLRTEASTLSQSLSGTRNEIEQEKSKIKQVQDRFVLIYNAIRSGVETKRQKVAQYGEGI